MSFAQILGTIQGFFSRGFWFGSFLPVALAGTLHLFLANRIFPQSSPWELLSASGSQAAKFPVIFAGAFVGLNLFQSGFTQICPLNNILSRIGIKNGSC